MNLEDKIQQLQGQFDFKEPNIGHFNRFEKRLKKHSKSSFKKYTRVAAIFLLFIIIGFIALKKHKNTLNSDAQFKQTETYFSQVIKEEIKKVNTQKNTENEQIINDAFLQMQILEKEFQKLQKDLKNKQNKQTIIYAMLENYQQRILILQNLLHTLKQYNRLKNTTYEIQNT